MEEKVYNDYLKELEAIGSKLAKELAAVSDALQTYIYLVMGGLTIFMLLSVAM